MLEIENLKTNFNTYDGVVKALDGVNLKIEDGEIFGLVGETGSGKSVTCYSALKLLPKAGEVVDGSIKLNGEDITNASDERLREIRGGEIGIIFQDPLSALNPVMTVNEQIGEILVLHQNAELQKLALEKEIPTFKSEKWKASPGVEFTIMAFCISFISLFVMLGQWRFSLPFLFIIVLMFIRDYLQRENLGFSLCSPDKYDDFSTLAECDVLIASSSTFVVCAGFLGKKNKKIIHSKEWINKNVENTLWHPTDPPDVREWQLSFDEFCVELYRTGGNKFYELWSVV